MGHEDRRHGAAPQGPGSPPWPHLARFSAYLLGGHMRTGCAALVGACFGLGRSGSTPRPPQQDYEVNPMHTAPARSVRRVCAGWVLAASLSVAATMSLTGQEPMEDMCA